MFLIHQIVNVLIDPIVDLLLFVGIGGVLLRRGRRKFGKALLIGAAGLLFAASWPPLVETVGAWLERDYPMVRAEEYPAADAIVVLGGGVGCVPERIVYPYPTLSEAADRVWFAAKLYHAQRTKAPGRTVCVYCSGPEVSRSTPPFLADWGVPVADVVPLDDPKNTEEEARRYEEALKGKSALLVTSALHLPRAVRIFAKYAPSVTVIPAPTDHQFLPDPERFIQWRWYLPSVGALSRAVMVVHELVGRIRYAF